MISIAGALPSDPIGAVVSRIFNPIFFDIFDTISAAKPSLSGNTCDDMSVCQINLNPFFAGRFGAELSVWAPCSS